MKKVKIEEDGDKDHSCKEETTYPSASKIKEKWKDDGETTEESIRSYFSPACQLSEFDPEKD